MNLSELKANRLSEVKLSEEIVNKAKAQSRPLTVEERAAVNAHVAEVHKIDAQIEELNASDAAIQAVEMEARKLSQPEARKVPAAQPEGNETYTRFGKLNAFKSEKRAWEFGQYVMALSGSEHAARKCRDAGIMVRGHTGGTPGQGGYLVPDAFAADIIDNTEKYSTARQFCRVVPMGRDTLSYPVAKHGISAAFKSEAAQITDSSSTFDIVQLTAQKLTGMALISSELSEDAAISIGDLVANDLAQAFAKMENDCLWIGDGSGTYGSISGIVTLLEAATTYKSYQKAASNHDLMSEIDSSDILSVMAALPQYADGNAKWYCSKQFAHLVFGRLKAAAGGNSVQTLQGGIGDNFLGAPIVLVSQLPSVTTDLSNKVMAVYGDLSKAVLFGDRRQVTIATSEHLKFDYDQIAVRATERFDIDVHSIGDATNAGPIVALIGE